MDSKWELLSDAFLLPLDHSQLSCTPRFHISLSSFLSQQVCCKLNMIYNPKIASLYMLLHASYWKQRIYWQTYLEFSL